MGTVVNVSFLVATNIAPLLSLLLSYCGNRSYRRGGTARRRVIKKNEINAWLR